MKKYYTRFEVDDAGLYGDIYQDVDLSQRIGWIEIDFKNKTFTPIHVDGIGFEWLVDFLKYLNIQNFTLNDRIAR